MISETQLTIKRLFDLCLSIALIPILIFPIIVLVVLSSIDTGNLGLYKQPRVGQHGKLFQIYKIRTLKEGNHQLGQLNRHATAFGRFIRSSKMNELPQVFNVLLGDMSFVGPRPDLAGFADVLEGDDRLILKVKPGITGPATIKYKQEEQLLSQQVDPETYNRTIIWPDKVEINKKYVKNWSFSLDLNILWKTIFG
ncbi:sugar transferase [Psychroserpens sp.]|uniref:sugar transferase n=1 Tax=Psychroserpens sp. TaxID=2020870 RepID=UPI002AA816E8|nr:sugar transferase [Psychroserpens sp.]